MHPQVSLVPLLPAGDYRAFLEDVRARGIVEPLEVTGAGVVLNGRHRLRAAGELGHGAVPCRIVEPEEEAEYIILGALRTRHLMPSQRAALAIELSGVQAAAAQAKERQRANLKHGKRRPEVASLPPRGEKTREYVARVASVGARTAQDALTVHGADPALFERIKVGAIAAEPAARRVRRKQRDAALGEAPPMPTGPFEVIYADPPWQLGHPDGAHAPENHYPTMPLSEIAALEIPAAENAILYLWVVNMLLPQGLQVLEAWGFQYKTNLFWVKESIGLGVWARNQHELLLVGRKGSFPPPEPDERPASVIDACRGDHSQKPDEVYALLERAHPAATKLELFARGSSRPGWAAWGNEVESSTNSDPEPNE